MHVHDSTTAVARVTQTEVVQWQDHVINKGMRGIGGQKPCKMVGVTIYL